MYRTIIAAAAMVATTALCQSSPPLNTTAPGNSWGNYNSTIWGSEVFYPDTDLVINYVDTVVFSFFTNGTSNSLQALNASTTSIDGSYPTLGANSVSSGYDTVTYPITNWPASITSYPYTAVFEVAASLSSGSVGNFVYITVNSTAGAPQTYASGATTAPTTSATSTTAPSTSTGSSTSSSASATPTGGAVGLAADARLVVGIGGGVAGMLAGMLLL